MVVVVAALVRESKEASNHSLGDLASHRRGTGTVDLGRRSWSWRTLVRVVFLEDLWLCPVESGGLVRLVVA